jgi:hypothetical protein
MLCYDLIGMASQCMEMARFQMYQGVVFNFFLKNLRRCLTLYKSVHFTLFGPKVLIGCLPMIYHTHIENVSCPEPLHSYDTHSLPWFR